MSSPGENNNPADNQATDSELDDLYSRGEEMERSEPTNGSTPSKGLEELPGGAVLGSLLRVAPFSAYMIHRARLEYQHSTIQGRFGKYIKDHKCINRFCTFMDLLLRTVIVILLVCVLVMFLAKALLPFPDWTP